MIYFLVHWKRQNKSFGANEDVLDRSKQMREVSGEHSQSTNELANRCKSDHPRTPHNT